MKLTFKIEKISVGYMAHVEEIPEIMVYSKNIKGLITRLIHNITGYEQAFPSVIENRLIKQEKKQCSYCLESFKNNKCGNKLCYVNRNKYKANKK